MRCTGHCIWWRLPDHFCFANTVLLAPLRLQTTGMSRYSSHACLVCLAANLWLSDGCKGTSRQGKDYEIRPGDTYQLSLMPLTIFFALAAAVLHLAAASRVPPDHHLQGLDKQLTWSKRLHRLP